MPILRKATAGTMQSSDLMVTVEPHTDLDISVDSTVSAQFDHLIRQRIAETLQALGVTSGRVHVSDRGALDYAIAARVETAIRRASEV